MNCKQKKVSVSAVIAVLVSIFVVSVILYFYMMLYNERRARLTLTPDFFLIFNKMEITFML